MEKTKCELCQSDKDLKEVYVFYHREGKPSIYVCPPCYEFLFGEEEDE